MSTWITNFLDSLGFGPDSEPYLSGVLYDPNLSEDEKSAVIFEWLEDNCEIKDINLQDAVSELFTQYYQGGLYWVEAPAHYSSHGYQYHPLDTGSANRAIAIINPEDSRINGSSSSESPPDINKPIESWARIDDDYEDDPKSQPQAQLQGENLRSRDIRDPFDDDEFNPFAPPSATDLEMLSGAHHSYHSATTPMQYPPPIFYSNGSYDGDENSSESVNLDIDMTPLEMLVQIIQDVDPEKIEKAFEKCNYDFERTLEALMSARKSANQEIVVPFAGDVRSTQTCRHFLQGNCFRKDCWYSHDLDTTVCKFWLKGQCLKGETCEFNHFIDTSRVREPSPPPVKQQPPTMDDFDFPSLSLSSSSKVNKGSTKGGKANSNSQDSKKKKKNNATNNGKGGDSVGTLTPPKVEEKANAKTSSIPTMITPAISYSATAAAAASKPLTPLQRADNTEERRNAFRLEMAPSSIPWLETGSTLNGEYLKSRAQAIEYGKSRNRCFELAAQAYLRNDGASAAKLSAQGREYNELMMATHRDASRQIFNSRNQSMVKSTSKSETWIDLHGLHIDESLAFLDEFMEKLETECYSGTVYVVTGTGNHSSNSRAKLKPAIVDWLESWGYVWKEMSIDRVHGGVLGVQVIKGKA